VGRNHRNKDNNVPSERPVLLLQCKRCNGNHCTSAYTALLYFLNAKYTAPIINAKLIRYLVWNGSFRYNTANTEKTTSVMISCVIFSWKPLNPLRNPARLAGTMRQYSKNAIPQLTRITFHRATLVCLRWPYQANVMKILDKISSVIVLSICCKLVARLIYCNKCRDFAPVIASLPFDRMPHESCS
jgi:hypothetical protein